MLKPTKVYDRRNGMGTKTRGYWVQILVWSLNCLKWEQKALGYSLFIYEKYF